MNFSDKVSFTWAVVDMLCCVDRCAANDFHPAHFEHSRSVVDDGPGCPLHTDQAAVLLPDAADRDRQPGRTRPIPVATKSDIETDA